MKALPLEYLSVSPIAELYNRITDYAFRKTKLSRRHQTLKYRGDSKVFNKIRNTKGKAAASQKVKDQTSRSGATSTIENEHQQIEGSLEQVKSSSGAEQSTPSKKHSRNYFGATTVEDPKDLTSPILPPNKRARSDSERQ